jgi:drug/metabolite transporter (DMT)-like permease
MRSGQPVVFLVLWSSGSIAATYGLAQISTQSFLLLRSAGTAVLAGLVWAVAARQPLPREPRVWGRVLAAGFFMQVAYQGFFYLAMSGGISPGLMALIVGAQPLVTVAIGRVRDARLWAAILAGLAGVAMAVAGDLTGGVVSAASVAFAAASLLAITAATIIQAANPLGVWPTLAVQSSLGVVFFGAFALIFGVGKWQPGWGAVGSVAWMVVVVGLVSTTMLYSMTRKRGAIAVSTVMLLVPAATAVEDLAVRGTPIGPLELAGCAITTVALAYVLRIQTRDSSKIRSLQHFPGRERRSAAAAEGGREG